MIEIDVGGDFVVLVVFVGFEFGDEDFVSGVFVVEFSFVFFGEEEFEVGSFFGGEVVG